MICHPTGTELSASHDPHQEHVARSSQPWSDSRHSSALETMSPPFSWCVKTRSRLRTCPRSFSLLLSCHPGTSQPQLGDSNSCHLSHPAPRPRHPSETGSGNATCSRHGSPLGWRSFWFLQHIWLREGESARFSMGFFPLAGQGQRLEGGQSPGWNPPAPLLKPRSPLPAPAPGVSRAARWVNIEGHPISVCV